MRKISDNFEKYRYGSIKLQEEKGRTKLKFCKGVYADEAGNLFAAYQYLDRKQTKINKKPTVKGNSEFWFEPIEQSNIFSSIEEAIKTLNLDRRRKWEVWNGELCYPFWYNAPCSGCSCDCSDGHGCNHGNAGCHECGYTGKRRNVVPVPALMPDGSIVKIQQDAS